MQGEVGEDMYMVVKGEVKLTSVQWPKFTGAETAFCAPRHSLRLRPEKYLPRQARDKHKRQVENESILLVSAGKLWGDGAFFGELPILGMGGGPLRKMHVYDVHCAVVTDLTFLTAENLRELDGDFPAFKTQVQKLAAKRAQRFGTLCTLHSSTRSLLRRDRCRQRLRCLLSRCAV